MIVEPYRKLDAKLKSIGAAKDVAEAGKIAEECQSILAAMEHSEDPIPPTDESDLPQKLWVYGPKDGQVLVCLTEQEPRKEDMDLTVVQLGKYQDAEIVKKIPRALMTPRACRRIAWLLNQAADSARS